MPHLNDIKRRIAESKVGRFGKKILEKKGAKIGLKVARKVAGAGSASLAAYDAVDTAKDFARLLAKSTGDIPKSVREIGPQTSGRKDER